MYERAQFSPDTIASVCPGVRSDAPAGGFYRQRGKRLFDILFVLAILPFLVAVVLLLALIVRCDGGPAFFLHERVGRGGKPFKCLKLRTMVVNAEARLEDYLSAHPNQRMLWQRDYKLKNDPRITVTGRVLRRLSLDELPQFFNVLLGQMSIVGPRPITLPELEFYADQRGALLSVLPGLTGPWQVGGRNKLAFVDRVRLDLGYVRQIGFWRDLKLIMATVAVAVKGTGV